MKLASKLEHKYSQTAPKAKEPSSKQYLPQNDMMSDTGAVKEQRDALSELAFLHRQIGEVIAKSGVPADDINAGASALYYISPTKLEETAQAAQLHLGNWKNVLTMVGNYLSKTK